MIKLQGAEDTAGIVFPLELQSEAERSSCIEGYPDEASGTTLVPVELLNRMYPS